MSVLRHMLVLELQLVLFLLLLSLSVSSKKCLPPHQLRTNSQNALASSSPFSNFVVVPSASRPRLQWILRSPQASYEIEIETFVNNFQSKTKRWRTGQVNSSNPLAATYSAAAPPLLPNAAVQWRVRVWTTSNTSIPTNWSAYSSFRVGKNEQDWIGKWITSSANDEERVNDQAYDENCTTSAFGDHPNFLFRRLFHAGSNVTRATLHVVGLGYYRVSIDGSLVPGDTFLDPPWTSFDRTVSSAMLDVTSLFRGHARQHIIEVELGNGWWNPLPLKFWGSIDVSQHLPTGKPMFRLDLILETSSKNMIVLPWTISVVGLYSL